MASRVPGGRQVVTVVQPLLSTVERGQPIAQAGRNGVVHALGGKWLRGIGKDRKSVV